MAQPQAEPDAFRALRNGSPIDDSDNRLMINETAEIVGIGAVIFQEDYDYSSIETISLEDALKDFEEGIKLASGMEKQLDEIEGKIQILMNEPNPMSKDNPPQTELFSDDGEVNGTRK